MHDFNTENKFVFVLTHTLILCYKTTVLQNTHSISLNVVLQKP